MASYPNSGRFYINQTQMQKHFWILDEELRCALGIALVLLTALSLYHWNGTVVTFYYRYWYHFHQNCQHYEVWVHLVLFIFAFSEPNTVPSIRKCLNSSDVVYQHTSESTGPVVRTKKALGLKIYLTLNHLERMVSNLTRRVPLFIDVSLCP